MNRDTVSKNKQTTKYQKEKGRRGRGGGGGREKTGPEGDETGQPSFFLAPSIWVPKQSGHDHPRSPGPLHRASPLGSHWHLPGERQLNTSSELLLHPALYKDGLVTMYLPCRMGTVCIEPAG